MTVGKTILEQIGGNKFAVMTGAKNFVTHEHGLSFKIGRNSTSANHVVIALEPNDTYTMSFSRMSISRKTFEVKNKHIEEVSGVYCDNLEAVFSSVTGMVTRLF